MNYERFILELFERVAILEEKVSCLENAKTDGDQVSELKNSDKNSVPKGFLAVFPKKAGANNLRDTTRYLFDGKKYGKNRLVLAVVKKYMADNNDDLYSFELMSTFDRSLQGSLGVVRTLEDAIKSCKDPEMRFFCRPDEIIHALDEDCVVCTQWAASNITNLIKRAEELGMQITTL